MSQPAPRPHFSTTCAPGDHTGPVQLIERLPGDTTAERWHASLPLSKGPPLSVLAIASAVDAPPRGAVDRWQDGDVSWAIVPWTPPASPQVVAAPPTRATGEALSPEALRAMDAVRQAVHDGRFDDAIHTAEEVWDLVGKRRWRTVSDLFALLYERTPPDHPEAARAGLLRAVTLTPAGRTTEAMEVASAAVTRSSSSPIPIGHLHYLVAMLHMRQGHLDEAEHHARAAIACLRVEGGLRRLAPALTALALVHLERSEFEASEQLFREALAVARQSGQPEAEAIVYGNYARLLRQTGRLEEARRCLLADLTLARAVGSTSSVGIALSNLAGMLKEAGHTRAALVRHHEVIDWARAAGRLHSEAVARTNTGALLMTLEAFDASEAHLRAALELHRRTGATRPQASVLGYLADLALARGRPAQLRDHVEAMLTLGQAAGNTHQTHARWLLARLEVLEGTPLWQALPELDAATERLWTQDQGAAVERAFATEVLVIARGGATAHARLEALQARLDQGPAASRAHRLQLAQLWLDLGASDHAEANLQHFDATPGEPAGDQALEADALRTHLALLQERPAEAHRALARAEARPEPHTPRARRALDAARADADAHLATCPLLGGYRLLRVLGQGGFGRVWEAVATDGSRRVVALKELTDGGHLEREARLGGRLRHRHLVDVYGVGVEDGVAWCAMELCDGGTVSAHLPLPPRAVVDVALQVCEALAYASEELGLVHLDLKPENLLVVGNIVKVADLGIAHVAADGHTRVARGTPAFMAPEQRSGAPVDARTDVWAMGVVLTELATGQPSRAPATYDWAATPDAATPPPSEAPGWLTSIVDRCLRYAPDDRFPDASALAAALRALPLEGPGLADVLGAPRSAPAPERLFGRDEPRARIGDALDAGVPMILEGPLGIGKTALARAALADRRARRGERDVEISAAGVHDEASLTRALGAALGAPLESALQDFGEGVVLLDGVDDPATVEVALAWGRRAPDLRWLFTSRLALPGPDRERLEVTPLSPEDGHALVVARARARGADTDDSAAISALVRRLGGLPLALELAAGRLGVFSAAELAEQLDPSWLRSSLDHDEHADLSATLRQLLDELAPPSLAVVRALAGAEAGLELAELATVPLPDGAFLTPVLDDLLSRSVVSVDRGRFQVPRVLAWSVREAHPA